MKNWLAAFICIAAFVEPKIAQASKVVVGGRLYELIQLPAPVCPPSPGTLVVDAAFGMNLSLGQAACRIVKCLNTGRPEDECKEECSETSQWVKAYALRTVFEATWKYPSFESGKECEVMRDRCTELCMEQKMYSEKSCVVRCNQYNVDLAK